MATIATLAVALEADTARFHSGMNKASGELKSLARSASIAAGTMAASFAAQAIQQGISAIVSGVQSAVQEVSALVDQADKLGVSFDSFVGLAHAAELSGSNVEVLDKSLTTFQRNLGSGKADATLGRLGLSIENLRNQKVDVAFLQTVDALRQLNNEAAQAAASQELFGRSSSELTNLINQGSVAIKDQVKDAETLGLTLSGKSAHAIEGMGDAWSDASNAIKGRARETLEFFTPLLHGVADFTQETITWGDALTDTFNGMEKSILKIDAAKKQAQIDGLLPKPQQVAQTEADIKLLQSFSKTQQALQQEIELYGKSRQEVEIYKLAKEGLDAQSVQSLDALRQELVALDAQGKAREEAARAQESQRREMESAQEQLKSEAARIVEATRTPHEAFETQIADLSNLLKAGALDWDTYNRAALQAAETLMETEDLRFPVLDLQSAAPAALEKGTVGAASAINQGRSDLKRLEDLERQNLQRQDKQVELLGKIAAAAADTKVFHF